MKHVSLVAFKYVMYVAIDILNKNAMFDGHKT